MKTSTPWLLVSLVAALVPRPSSSELHAAPRVSSIRDRLLATQPGADLLFELGDDARVFEVTRDALTGDGLELRRFPGHLRGHVGSEPVDLVLAPPRITGQLGDHEISLDMLPTRPGVRVVGRFGARAIGLAIRVEAIEGEVGPCRYRLALVRGQYDGQVGCGGGPERVRLSVPVAFVARSDAEVAAMLIAIFAR
jgi:hypothetical protein